MNLEYIRNLSRLGIEVWKDIPNFVGYQASNLGNIRSFIHKKNGRKTDILNFKPKKMKKRISNNNRHCITLVNNKKKYPKNIAQLVAMAFLNHKPCGMKLVVDHIDNNSLNDKLYNLQVITHRQNNFKDRKGTSKYIGVSWNKRSKKWRSQITFKISTNPYRKKTIGLGYFTNELEAANAYQKALKEYETKEVYTNTKNKKIREYSKSNLYEC